LAIGFEKKVQKKNVGEKILIAGGIKLGIWGL
jgi:hypothetical protein